MSRNYQQTEDELNAACEAAGFELDCTTWLADEDGNVMMGINFSTCQFAVYYGPDKKKNREFDNVGDAINYAKTLVH